MTLAQSQVSIGDMQGNPIANIIMHAAAVAALAYRELSTSLLQQYSPCLVDE